MRGVPRRRVRTAPLAVVMAELGAAIRGNARPVPASKVGIAGKGSAVQLRTSQNVVPVGAVAAAVDGFAILGEGGFFVQIVFISVKVFDVISDADALGIVPRP